MTGYRRRCLDSANGELNYVMGYHAYNNVMTNSWTPANGQELNVRKRST